MCLRLQNEKGQGVIESLALAFALITLVTVLGGVLYFSVVHVGINYLLHEHLVCEQTEGQSECKKDFLKKSKVFLTFARLQKFESSNSRGLSKAQVVIALPLNRQMKIKKELALYR